MVNARKGIEIPEPDFLYNPWTSKNTETHERIDRIDKETDQKALDKNRREFVQIPTPFNIDEECSYSAGAYQADKSMFINEEYHKYFANYFKETCGNRNSCIFDPDVSHDRKRTAFDPKVFPRSFHLLSKLSDKCIKRIKEYEVTSRQLIAIMGCQDDTLVVPFYSGKLHKQTVGIIIVSVDMLSIIIMALFFNKLQDLNAEYLDIVDGMNVQMKDFAVKIDNF